MVDPKIFSWKIGARKAFEKMIIFAIPAAIDFFARTWPDVWNLPIGAALVFVWDYVKRVHLAK